ncbi:polysaccharide deacetylase family protein [Clostridium lacusfryxellense]|uniref:polysaccharide deacetylase family protein n=1 Tax=Clostridium lacusfryxellense TaxID=205328 RepID=UPI001C0D95DC|nr:polysaccharide deacetylase family protein [Clostridium lacusfryxellense]MBU3111036.1 polysaccharide deacetylase family protein [Clostridium lacusfryxellense]
MKKKIAFIVMILLLLSSQIVLAASGVVNTSALRVRQRASVSSSVLGSLSRNEKVNTLGKVGNFYKVSYKGKTGYVDSHYIKLVNSTQIVTSVKIPVLMYHNLTIASKSSNPLIIPQKTFRAHMSYLKKNGYNTISMDQLNNYLKNKASLPSKPVVITFDDGYVSNYTLAYPILKANKQKATVFMIAAYIDTNKRFLTSKQIKAMDANGIRIENHTNKHEKLATLTYANQLTTITKTKQVLEKLLGRKVNYIAYPYGSYNSNTIKAAKVAGCTLGLSTEAGLTSRADNVYSVNRIFVNVSDTTSTLARKLK